MSCYDKKTRTVYAVYHGSRTKYGESHDVFSMSVIPIDHPEDTKQYVIVESGIEIDGRTYTRVIDGNIILVDNVVRICFLSDYKDYYYIDFNISNKTFSKINMARCFYNSTTHNLNSDEYEAFITQNGYKGIRVLDPYELIINTGKMYKYKGYWYGCLTASYSFPVIYKTRDGVTYEFIGVVPALAKYEAQTAIADGKLYCLLRGAKEENFFVSEDLGKTFAPVGRIEYNETRPQLLNYNNKLLMGISLVGIEPNLVRDGRNNLKLLIGDGNSIESFKEVFFIVDKYGIVYYDIFNCDGELYMLWSNADLYLDKSNHAKDLIYFSKIGDLSEYIK